MEKSKGIGICITCKNSPDCMNLFSPDLPKQFCEGFENETVVFEKQHSDDLSQQASSDQESFNGLCKNCDKRDECTQPHPEKVIWHCEEYQ